MQNKLKQLDIEDNFSKVSLMKKIGIKEPYQITKKLLQNEEYFYKNINKQKDSSFLFSVDFESLLNAVSDVCTNNTSVSFLFIIIIG